MLVSPSLGEIGRPLRTIEVHPPELPIPVELPEPEPDREQELEPEAEPIEVEA
jgi:hypothetical protein